MKKLPIKIFEIEGAWETRTIADSMYGEPMAGYLNIQTGEIEYSDPDSYDSNEEECPLFEDPNFLAIPDKFGWPKLDDFQVMSDFVDLVENPEIKNSLRQALQGARGVFRRFKDTVHTDVETLHHWRWYKKIRERQSIVAWLNENEIDPQWDRDIYQRPEKPSKRPDLCAAVVEFVLRTQQVEGVESISLFGSLTTDKKIPKDVDLLVQVCTDIPSDQIQKLAKFRRQLSGKTMATGDSCGADVFLCDTNYQYLGRLCEYRECHHRVNCEARNCGDHINDDLQNVTLEKSLMKSPPVILWPKIEVNIDLPVDVEELIVRPLNKSPI